MHIRNIPGPSHHKSAFPVTNPAHPGNRKETSNGKCYIKEMIHTRQTVVPDVFVSTNWSEMCFKLLNCALSTEHSFSFGSLRVQLIRGWVNGAKAWFDCCTPEKEKCHFPPERKMLPTYRRFDMSVFGSIHLQHWYPHYQNWDIYSGCYIRCQYSDRPICNIGTQITKIHNIYIYISICWI